MQEMGKLFLLLLAYFKNDASVNGSRSQEGGCYNHLNMDHLRNNGEI